MRELFNYISIALPKRVAEITDSFTFSRSRLFEYTHSDIRDSLSILDQNSINAIISLPTFICSEIYHESDHFEMFVIYGKITSINVSDSKVECGFSKIKDFGSLSFPNTSAAAAILGVDRFQLSRTHWAVKDGNFADVISRIIESNPQSGPGPEIFTSEKTNIKTNKRLYIGTCNTVESYLRIIRRQTKELSSTTFYRGHSNTGFDLLPSLLRKDSNGNDVLRPHEFDFFKSMIINHHQEFSSDENVFEKLVRMRHYGLPTRLLDVTMNPLVALFFSCYDRDTDPNVPGEVLLFDVRNDEVEYYDSESISILSNLSQITWEDAEKLDTSLDERIFNMIAPIRKISSKVKNEISNFSGVISKDQISTIKFAKSKNNNSRIKSQFGAFIVFGNDYHLPEDGNDKVIVKRIKINNKLAIIDELADYGINLSSVYPEMENTARYLLYKVTKEIR
jgi:hypothetical protein